MSSCVTKDLLLLLRLIFNTFGQIIRFIKKQLAHKNGFPLLSFLLSFALRILWSLSVLLNWTFFLLRLDLLRFFLKQKVIFPNCRISFLERAVTDCYYSKWTLCYLFVSMLFFFYAFHSQKSPGTMYYLNMTISINLSHNNNVNSILYKSRCLV